MHGTDDAHDALDLVAAEFAQRCRRGERPPIAEYAERYPELADEIRELFPTIVDLESAKASGLGSSSSSASMAPTPAIERLGDFRVIREIGRGGMGIVFEAEQESLGRRVAIKVLPQTFLNDARRADRFNREARTAAKLHHTNIVPIFGVGEDSGYHYFVMQYIHGVGLDHTFAVLTSADPGTATGEAPSRDLFELARALVDSDSSGGDLAGTETLSALSFDPREAAARGQTDDERRDSAPGQPTGEYLGNVYWRSLARAFAQAADAIAYAHSQGVLHRDIKPANLLLDADGVLWVSDFGLAKALEHDGLTEEGDVIGTLRYMAPEQFGGAGDERIDVYGLGVALYELATLRPAFARVDRKQLMRAIIQEDLTPPRKLVPHMPADLETIILKATSRDPAHRYDDAAQLRDDLNRFVDDRPIAARRVSSTERLWRWAKRNPALSAATAMVFVLLASLAVVFSAAYVNVRIANKRTESALAKAQQLRTHAEGTADLAIEALDSMLDELAPDVSATTLELSVADSEEYAVYVADPALLTPQSTQLLKHLLDYYQRLAQRDEDSAGLDTKVASANRRVGQIYELFGRFDDARAAYETAIKHYQSFIEHHGVDVATRVALAEVYNQLGALLAADAEGQEAHTRFAEARAVLEPAIEAKQPEPRAIFEAARTLYLEARRPGPEPGAGPGPFGGPDGPPEDRPRRGRRRGPPEDRPRRGVGPGHGAGRGRGRGPFNLRRLSPSGNHQGRGRRAGAREQFEKAVNMLSGLLQRAPDNPSYRHLLALCLRETHRPGAFRFDESTTGNVDRAAELFEELVKDYPDVPEYQLDLAETYSIQEYKPDAEERFKRGVAMLDELIAGQPHAAAYRFARAHAYLRRHRAYARRGDVGKAIDALQRALDELHGLITEFPEVGSFSIVATLAESRLAQFDIDRGDYGKAQILLEAATERLDGLLATDGTQPQLRGLAGSCFTQLAEVYGELGLNAKQQAAATRAGDLARPPAGFPPDGAPPPEEPPPPGPRG